MFGLRRREPHAPPEIPAEPKGVGVVTAADLLSHATPEAEHIVTPTGLHGVYLHTFKPASQTEAQRHAAEAAAVQQFDQSLAPGWRHPVTAQRPSIFGPADPDRFPGA